MSYKITDIEGIGPTFGKKLASAGIRTTAALLKQCGNKKGRSDLSSRSGIDETLILKWTNMADLMRITGVGEEYSELLEAAGVDTVNELRNRNPINLTLAMAAENAKRKLVRKLPSERMVTDWVKQAKGLKPAITY